MCSVHDFQQICYGDNQEDMLFNDFNNYAHLASKNFTAVCNLSFTSYREINRYRDINS